MQMYQCREKIDLFCVLAHAQCCSDKALIVEKQRSLSSAIFLAAGTPCRLIIPKIKKLAGGAISFFLN